MSKNTQTSPILKGDGNCLALFYKNNYLIKNNKGLKLVNINKKIQQKEGEKK